MNDDKMPQAAIAATGLMKLEAQGRVLVIKRLNYRQATTT